MEKSSRIILAIIGCAFLYAITSFTCAFLGFLSPWCWIVVFPALAAILGAPSYLWAASRWQRFGVATLFSVLFSVILFSMGEINIIQTALMIIVGFVSDDVRQLVGNKSEQGALFAYPVLSLGVIAWLMKLWTDSEWYYQGAAEEIGIDYAEGLKTLSSIWALLLVIALTLAVSYYTIKNLFCRYNIKCKNDNRK